MTRSIMNSWPRRLRVVLAWAIGFSSVLFLILLLALLLSKAGLDSCDQVSAPGDPWVCGASARALIGVGLLLALLPLVNWWSRQLTRFASSKSQSDLPSTGRPKMSALLAMGFVLLIACCTAAAVNYFRRLGWVGAHDWFVFAPLLLLTLVAVLVVIRRSR